MFRDINFSISKGQKIALIGDNGSGKSTLLEILAGRLAPASGNVALTSKPFYIPQHFGQYDDLTVAEALGIDHKMEALHAILNGDASLENFTQLDDDWNVEERALAALSLWDIQHIDLFQPMKTISGGEKTKVFLSGIAIHSPSIIFFDEPSNHLDIKSRKQLHHLIQISKATTIVVSHDRALLNLLDITFELNQNGLEAYGGNYEFFKMQKEEKLMALEAQADHKEKALRQAKQIAREASERKQKENSRGSQKQINKGVPRIFMNTIKNRSEQSTSKLQEVHSDKVKGILQNLQQLKQQFPEVKEFKMTFENSNLHKGKILITAHDLNFGYSSGYLWQNTLNFQIRSGERIAISGKNGSGKTTLLKLIMGKVKPSEGTLTIADFKHLYIDQEYSVLDNELTVFEQVQEFNSQHLPEHRLKTLLHQFLFKIDMWDKTCGQLSGGEKIKLIFCCLVVGNSSPELIILDEPTNNLDVQSLEVITSSIKHYKGTLLVISHDEYFINEIGVNERIAL
ncbi:ABC-F family ATP-binding cassette domain-containing protein [Pedobacter sp. V48]|uniref:ABC-F family ATP-binding cassette domain-containing protein n=1 Tax=Pedobacter sp. V48 TaxID=509635 RepID=UPI001F43607C|nr:ABC-F family ATP-binding cassette domain-containing protein [Pedobacter sp. V48]